MAEWIYVCRTEELAPGNAKVVVHNDEPIAVFNADGTYFAVSNICPHAAGPLEHGFIEDCRIICPWHGWSFALSPEEPPNDGLARYRVRVEDGAIQVAYPAIETDKRWK